MRTPTPIEFECADPAAPCALPNDFTGDPPLKPVVVRTLSGGLRGTLRWRLAALECLAVPEPRQQRHPHRVHRRQLAGLFRQCAEYPAQGRGPGRGRRVSAGSSGRPTTATCGPLTAPVSSPERRQLQRRRQRRHPGASRRPPARRAARSCSTCAGEYRLDRQWSFGANLRAYTGQYAVGDENNRDRHGAVAGLCRGGAGPALPRDPAAGVVCPRRQPVRPAATVSSRPAERPTCSTRPTVCSIPPARARRPCSSRPARHGRSCSG